MQIITNNIESKLQKLFYFLCDIAKGFDTIAEEIDNENLRNALLAVAVESEQYATEIKSQMEELHITLPHYHNTIWKDIELHTAEQAGTVRGGEIYALCNNCDAHFTKFYEDLLQENLNYKNLKEIISYQLYAAKCAFMKIKLLNTIRFNNN